jgi:glycosyltransferase involved in cell wall biosynthesis
LTNPSQVESTARISVRAEQISFLIYSPFPKYSGGRENWLHNLAPHLRKRGERVRVISFAANRAPFYSLEQSGIEVVALPSVRYFYRAFVLLNRISLGLLKYLDVFIFYPLIAGIFLARTRPPRLVCMNPVPEGLVALMARVPYVVSVRSDVPKGLAAPYRFLERPFRWVEHQVLRRAVKVLANGLDTQERLARTGIVSTVVPNGVDFERFSQPAAGDALVEELERKANSRPVIAFIATLQAIKGAADAVDCAAELKRREAVFVLAMVGKGDPGPFKRRSQALGLDGWVEFLGETNAVPAVLQRSRIFLGLSLENGMSMSALEAMAAGIPVVARDVPTYQQLIENESSGLLGSTPAELADCCLRLLRDPDKAHRLAGRAQTAARDYDWPRVADILLAEAG